MMWLWLLVVAVETGVGLLLGRAVYAFWLAFVTHKPECPNKQAVLDNARRVAVDVDDLTMNRARHA